MRILISGGGTGGHVFPAIAIADHIKEIEPETEFLFVGALGKIEMEKVPKAGYPIKGLWISGFHRKLTLRNLMFPIKLISSLIKARGIVRRFKPDVAVGVGGFASGPTLEMATRAGIPALIQEQNSYAGVTNKLLAKKVDKICVAYPEMNRYFPAQKIVLTGNPVRDAILNRTGTKADAIKHFGLDANKSTILLFGGSLGARSMNQAMREQHELLKQNPDVQVIWQCGKLYIEEYKDCATAQLPNVKILEFIDRMDLAYELADVVVARSGALTISELCLVGKPVVLIPSPNVAEDHQTKNARALSDRDAAILVPDKDAKAQIMETPLRLLKDEVQREKLSKNIAGLAKPNAATDIAETVLALGRSNNKS